MAENYKLSSETQGNLFLQNQAIIHSQQWHRIFFKMEQTESSVALYLASKGLDGSISSALLPDIKYQALPLLICTLFLSFCSCFPI